MGDSFTTTFMLELVAGERADQDQKWGEQNHDLPTWMTILGEEYGEVCKAVLDSRAGTKTGKATLEDVKRELIQVAAVAVAALECIDREQIRLESLGALSAR